MAKKRISKKILGNIRRYLGRVNEFYKVENAILFGSFAKGTQHEDSDIDIAIITNDMTDDIEDTGKMFALAWGIDTRIEPHPFTVEEFQNREPSILHEIIATGIPVPL